LPPEKGQSQTRKKSPTGEKKEDAAEQKAGQTNFWDRQWKKVKNNYGV